MHTVSEVFTLLQRQVHAPSTLEHVPVAHAAGRILGQAIAMDSDSPPFDRALLDGFAVRSSDAHAGARLLIVGRQDAAPAIFQGAVGQGQALAINTGGVFPQGADAVLMVEHTRPVPATTGAGEWVEVLEAVRHGHGVQKRGADAKMGQYVLSEGIHLGPAQLAAAVCAGATDLAVRPVPRVALLTTGDELVAAGAAITGGQIRNSNHPMLAALIRQALATNGGNGELLDLGVCRDSPEELRPRIERGLAQADLTIVTGGMSMGSKDYVPAVLRELGIEFHVEKVRMKPGKPFAFGTRDTGPRRTHVAGLPGNPVSAFVTFHLFVARILSHLAGAPSGIPWIQARATAPFLANGDREFFQPCNVARAGEVLAAPLHWRGSGDIFTLARAQALAHRPVNAPELKPGENVEILLL